MKAAFLDGIMLYYLVVHLLLLLALVYVEVTSAIPETLALGVPAKHSNI
jgi:hypothetical protein